MDLDTFRTKKVLQILEIWVRISLSRPENLIKKVIK